MVLSPDKTQGRRRRQVHHAQRRRRQRHGCGRRRHRGHAGLADQPGRQRRRHQVRDHQPLGRRHPGLRRRLRLRLRQLRGHLRCRRQHRRRRLGQRLPRRHLRHLPHRPGALQRQPRPRLLVRSATSPTATRRGASTCATRSRSRRTPPAPTPGSTTTGGTSPTSPTPRCCSGSPSSRSARHRAGAGRLVGRRQQQLRRARRRVPAASTARPSRASPASRCKTIAPNKRGPVKASGRPGTRPPSRFAGGQARVAWQSAYDMDNKTLTYNVYRSGTTAPVYTTTADSTYWNYPMLGFIDKNLTPGSSYTYTVRAVDPFGNTLNLGTTSSVTISAGSAERLLQRRGRRRRHGLLAPRRDLRHDGLRPRRLQRRGRSAGCDAGCRRGDRRGQRRRVHVQRRGRRLRGRPTRRSRPRRACPSSPGSRPRRPRAARSSATATPRPGTSGSYDRHIYMDNAGHIIFGVYNNGTYTVTSPKTYNDGTWHQIVGTLDPHPGHGPLHRRQEGRCQPERRPAASPTRATGGSVGTTSVAGRTSRPATSSTAPSTTSRSTRRRWRWPRSSSTTSTAGARSGSRRRRPTPTARPSTTPAPTSTGGSATRRARRSRTPAPTTTTAS